MVLIVVALLLSQLSNQLLLHEPTTLQTGDVLILLVVRLNRSVQITTNAAAKVTGIASQLGQTGGIEVLRFACAAGVVVAYFVVCVNIPFRILSNVLDRLLSDLLKIVGNK